MLPPRCLLPDASFKMPPRRCLPRCHLPDASSQMLPPRCLLPDASSQMPSCRCFLRLFEKNTSRVSLWVSLLFVEVGKRIASKRPGMVCWSFPGFTKLGRAIFITSLGQGFPICEKGYLADQAAFGLHPKGSLMNPCRPTKRNTARTARKEKARKARRSRVDP